MTDVEIRSDRRVPRVAVIGGGISGLAAAVAAAENGLSVEVFESRRKLGGRAGSFRDRVSDQPVDYCQHVAMGCCTHLADFCRRIGAADCFSRQRRLHFVGPTGTRHDFAAARLLPAPLHLFPGLMRLGYLSLAERLRIVRTIGRLAREEPSGDDPGETIGRWLHGQGESARALSRFWSVVLVSALGETLDRASLPAARKVFVDGFFASARAYELEVPNVPLQEIFDRRAGQWLERHGVVLHRGTRIDRIDGDSRRATALVTATDNRSEFDFYVVALPWRRVRSVFAPQMLDALPELDGVDRIESAAITAVHLWFDRPITRLPNAVLVERLSQWVFNHGPTQPSSGMPTPAHRYQVVVSASGELCHRGRRSVVDEVCGELREIWPAARDAKLLNWRISTNREAVFSVRPGVDRHRPGQSTSIENLMLAGDWTNTGWPATMEGAVRSGYLAIEAIQTALGRDARLLAADLPRGWLARRLGAYPRTS